MTMGYPIILKKYPSGQIGVFFPDVPEAITAGRDQIEAIKLAQDALVTALSGYLDDGRVIPSPSPRAPGQPTVVLPPQVVFKIAIHTAMREQGMNQAGLAARLGIDERQVRRILELHHESRFSQLDTVLATLGMSAEISVSKISPVDLKIAA